MNRDRSLLQLVPALSPPATGVGDYALGVAARLQRDHAIGSRFLVCNRASGMAQENGGFEVRILRARSAAALLDALQTAWGVSDSPGTEEPQAALLHLSPYGYDINGCPFWLANGLRAWVDRAPARRVLITMFHELYATGAPWTKAFWYSALQKRIVRRILDCSGAAMTNTRYYADELGRWSASRKLGIRCLAVPSSVGEPGEVPAIERRSKRLCVFGTRPGKRPLGERTGRLLKHAVQSWPIEEIALVGESPVPATFENLGCRVVPYHGLPAGQIAGLLEDSILGLLWYPAQALGKSTIYAAYSAFGVPAMLLPVPGFNGPSLEGLRQGRDYVDDGALALPWNPHLLQSVAANVRARYPAQNLSVHANAVAELVRHA